jgi:DNA-binding protein HU-beta
MNKSQLVEVLAGRLGDRRTAAAAVDGLLETIVDTVRSGETVALTGFGVFEGRARAARTVRNPRTGTPVDVPATTVPAFRPGAGFRAAVGTAIDTAQPVNGRPVADVGADVAVAPAAPPAVRTEPAKNGGKAKGKDRDKNGDKNRGKDRGKDGGKAGKGKKPKSKK